MSRDTSNPVSARQDARAMDGIRVDCMPSIPASSAKNLPDHISAEQVIWDEVIAPGGYSFRKLPRGTRLRLVNTNAEACAQLLVYNADNPIERLNVADTVKVQWNAYLGQGKLLLSDMGRVLMSITEDSCGNHDTLCGYSTPLSNAAIYGRGENYSGCPSASDRFLIALAKNGMGRRDLMASVSLFKGVRVNDDGALVWVESASTAGDVVELRSEMNTLVIIANTPHVLDPRPRYTVSKLRVTGYSGSITSQDDPIRMATPEALRAYQNVEDYYAGSNNS